jgi:hypothetical protein
MKPPTHIEAGLFAAEAEQQGAHFQVRVRAGVPGQRVLLGTLVMREAEWLAFAQLLKGGVDVSTTRHDLEPAEVLEGDVPW